MAQTVASSGPTELGASVLGASLAGAGGFFAGALDEVQLYPRALAEWELAELAGVAGSGEAVTAAPSLGWSGTGSATWRLEFALTGPEPVTVEGSRDLQVWRPEAWFEGAAGLNAWPAPAPVGPGPLFYRLRLGR